MTNQTLEQEQDLSGQRQVSAALLSTLEQITQQEEQKLIAKQTL